MASLFFGGTWSGVASASGNALETENFDGEWTARFA